MFRGLTSAFLVFVSAGCSESVSPAPPTAPSPPVATHFTLSGTVFESTPEGQRPLGGAYLHEIDWLGGRGYGHSLRADADGRYSVANLPRGATAIITVVFSGRSGRLHQPCAATAIMNADKVVDVEYNAFGVRGTGGSPTLSGLVFEDTAAGRQAVPDKKVLYYGNDTLQAFTWTGPDGRYEFCRLPKGPGNVVVSVVEDFEVGGPTKEKSVVINGDAVLDIDITQ
jgi:hypothetical protein